jgi:deazaflavin-dependent oxidoreductase (nitroreductase family)
VTVRRIVLRAALPIVAAVLVVRWALARVDRARGALSRREHIALVLHRESDRRLSRLAVWVMRRTRGGLADRYHVEALVLTTTGRRTGQRRSVVLQCFEDDGAYTVVATGDGADRAPGWFRNLEADPAVAIEVRGRRLEARARVLPPPESADWWERILRLAPDYERYQRATDRAFPVVRLETVPTGTGALEPA